MYDLLKLYLINSNSIFFTFFWLNLLRPGIHMYHILGLYLSYITLLKGTPKKSSDLKSLKNVQQFY